MGFIGLGDISKNLIAIILGCIFCSLNRLLNLFVETKLFDNKILTNIFISFALFLNIIPYIIIKKSSKSNVLKNNIKFNLNKENKKFEFMYKDIEVNFKYKNFYIILIGIVFFANIFMFVYTFKIASNTWITYILFASIFYYLIFKAKLYSHHYLSIIIILLAGLIIDIIQNNFENDLNINLIGFIFNFVRVILLSFNFVIMKYTMEIKFASPYEIGLYSGLINLILFIIFAIFDHYFFRFNDYIDYFNNFKLKEIFIIFGLIITQFGLYLCSFIIDKNNSPCHIFIVFIFGQLAYYFKDIKRSLIVVIICLIIILFFSLVFNEIIELNFCGLSTNTKFSS